MLKMTIDNEEVVSKNNFTIKEEMLSPSSTILNNTYPKTWENDKDYTSRFYYPKDYAKLDIQNFSITPEEAGTTIDINGSATLSNVDATKESRVLSLKGQTSQNGTPTPSSPIPVNVVSGDNYINICGKNLLPTSASEWESGQYNTSGDKAGYATRMRLKKLLRVNPATTYYFSSALSGVLFIIREYDKNGSFIYNTGGLYNPTFTTQSSTYYLGITFDLTYSNYNETNDKLFMCFNNEIDKTYEPYTGNSYPIYLGVENLWNANNIKNGFLPTNGAYPTTNSSYPNSQYIIVPLLTGQKITLSGSTSSTGRVRYIDKDTNQVVGNITSTDTTYYSSTHGFVDGFYEATITAKKDFLVGIMDYAGGNNSLVVNYGLKQYISTTPIELCKIGNYQDSIYKGVGSNLADITYGTVPSTSTGSNVSLQYGCSSDYINVDINKTYIASYSGTASLYLFAYAEDNTYLGYVNGSYWTTLKTNYPTLKKVRVRADGSSSNPTPQVQFEVGSTATPYEPYNAKDKWLLHKEINKVILDNTYFNSKGTTGTNAYYLATTILTGLNDNTIPVAYSNMFQPCSFNNRANGLDITYSQSGTITLRTANNTPVDWSTKENAKTWLDNNKPIVYYILNTPTTTLITDSTLLEQLDDLESQ